jgi:hypothetical protein
MEKCEICNLQFKRLAPHVIRTHGINFDDYLIEHLHQGKRPLCGCGCGEETPFSNSGGMRFLDYIHGHFVRVRPPLSQDSRAKIGEKNRKNMKRLYAENPELKKEKGRQLNSNRNEDFEKRRIEKSNMVCKSEEYRNKMSIHAKSLWQRGDIMKIASKKSGETFKARFAAGSYDFKIRDEKISESITNLYISGRNNFSKGLYFSPKMNLSYNYRSSWEVEFMRYLDSFENVEQWFYEFDTISYFFEGKRKKYIPDFQVKLKDGRNFLVEVKPKALRKLAKNEAKREAAKSYCDENSMTYVEWELSERNQIFLDLNII